VDGLGLEGEKRRAMVAAALELDVADQPEVMDFVQAEAPGLGYDFEALLSAVGAAFPESVSDEAGSVIKIMSGFTGQDVARVVDRISAGRLLLTEERIIEAAKRHHVRTGRWPTKNSGDATEAFGFKTTWSAIHTALRFGCHGLPGGASLHRLLQPLTGNVATLLTEGMIINAAKLHHARTGRWPSKACGEAADDFGFEITWLAVNTALREGYRGLAGGSTLDRLLKEISGRTPRARRGTKTTIHLTEAAILEAARRHHARTGQWPSRRSGDATQDIGHRMTWAAVSHALSFGFHGLAGGSTLTKLLQPSLSRVVRQASDLTEETLLQAAKRYHDRTGRWPTQVSGDATDDLGFATKWNSIDQALRAGRNGLPGGSSLSKLLAPLKAENGGAA
jgi:hypothetical protein